MSTPTSEDLEFIASMSEDRLAKLIDLNAESVVHQVLAGECDGALETARYWRLLVAEMNRR
jgi:hypothetical protein